MRSILSNHSALAESREHVSRTVEIRDFDVRGADALWVVRIRAYAWSNIETPREFFGSKIQGRVGDLRIKYFDHVQLTCRDERLQHRHSQTGPFGIKRMRCIHQATLSFDAVNHLGNRQHVRNPLRQEQADNFSGRGADLFANNNANSEVATEGLGRVDRMMVRDAHHIEVHRFDAFGQLLQRGPGVARSGRVQMTVEPYPTGAGWRWRPGGNQQQNGD